MNQPRQLGSYRLLGVIARGGMATVYLGRQVDFDFDLDPRGQVPLRAIKRLHPHLAERPELLERFRREADVLRALDHPNVVRAFETGEDRGEHYIVTELLCGRSLAEVMLAAEPEGIPFALLAHLIARAADGLEAAHQLDDLVHGDVSPQNLLVTFGGQIKLLDFGLAAPARFESETSSYPPGKLAYLAPEQLVGGRVDRRADLFALGVVLWEAVAQKRLFKRERTDDTLARIIGHRVPPPSRFAPDLPRSLEAIIIRAVRHDPEGRYRTAAELAADLDRLVDELGGEVDREAVRSWMSGCFGLDPDPSAPPESDAA